MYANATTHDLLFGTLAELIDNPQDVDATRHIPITLTYTVADLGTVCDTTICGLPSHLPLYIVVVAPPAVLQPLAAHCISFISLPD